MSETQYQMAYDEWVKNMTPEERAEARKLGVLRPDEDGPAVRASCDADACETDRRGEWKHPVDEMEPAQRTKQDEKFTEFAEAFARIAAWLSEADSLNALGVRSEIMLFMLFPTLRNRKSYEDIAELPGCDTTRQNVCKLAIDFKDTFAMLSKSQPRGMRSNETRQKCKQSQINSNQLRARNTSTDSTKLLNGKRRTVTTAWPKPSSMLDA